MIENIVVLLIIVSLTFTATRRNYIGVLVSCYYAIFIFLDLDFFGWSTTAVIFTDFNTTWEVACLFLCLSVSLIASWLYYKGSNLCFFYSAWLIWNALLCYINAVFTYDVDSVYDLTQNMNLIIDTIVVILGTDNILHRVKSGYILKHINGFIDNIRFLNGTCSKRLT